MRRINIVKQITHRETQSLEKYLQEIAKIELITTDEEVLLAQRIRHGDQIALEKMISANLRFVVSVAKQYQNAGLSLCDLINEGNVGLVKAAKRFDETRGFKFISYAVWWIRQAIMQALTLQARLVRVPVNRVGLLNKVGHTISNLEQQLEREPSTEEVAIAMNIAPEEILDTVQMSARSVSLQAPFSAGEESSLLDLLVDNSFERPDSVMLTNSLRFDLQRFLTVLTTRQRDIVILFFGLNDTAPMSLQDIGLKFNLTTERVRQIKETALRRLRTKGPHQLVQHYIA